MKKLTVAAVALTTLLSGNVFAHEAGEFFIRAGSATVRPTEGAGGTLGSLGGFDVSNNTQLGLTFTYMATDNIGSWQPRRSAIKLALPQQVILRPFTIYRRP